MTTFQIIGVIFMAVVAVGIILGLRKGDRRDMRCVLMMLTLLAIGQGAFAESSWTIDSSYNPSTHKTKFSIKRSEYTYPQIVLYRTVGLSAYAGQHYTAVSGELNFTANDSIKEIEVTELNPNDYAYMFQNGSNRIYNFEVTDRGGFLLVSAQRAIPIGNSVDNSSSVVFGEKELNIKSEQFTVTDAGYNQAYHSVNVNNYYSASAPKNYFTTSGAQLRMTVTLDAREKDDGYQYIAIYANTSTSNVDTGDKNGDPGTIYYSRYMAGFTIDGNVNTTFYPYTFPVTSQGNSCGYVEHPWSGNPKGNLEQQYFNTNCRATDGRLIIPTDLSSLYVRFDASGNLDDDWYAKNVKAHIQAVDNSAPTLKGIVVNPGRHARGNTVYVSVAFSEIVKVTGTPTLSVYWGETSGTLDYTSGSGSNVLTFKGIIPKTVSGKISITGYDGTIQDLAGNDFSGSISHTDLFSTNADLAYALSDFRQDYNHNYLITCHDDLRGLAGLVNNGGDTSGKTFRQVTNLTFPYSTQWNTSSSKENNFTSIGNSDHPFQGTYDGEGHTISGIRIYKDGEGAPNNYQGLFGKVSGTVKRVHLTDTRITGKSYVGGIAGETNSATIEECTVANNVCIHAVRNSSVSHGGVVGLNRGTVQSCISHATLSIVNTNYGSAYGGIVGRCYSGSITDCLAIGVTIPGVDSRGAILGYRSDGSLTCNYYLNCTVAGTANAINVGFNGTDYFNGNSARALYALTLGQHIAIDHDPSATLPGSGNITYDNGADINGQPYSYNTASLNLTYNGNLPTGYHAIFTATAGTINGNTLTMPASAVTVSSNFAVNTYSVRFKSNSSSATGSMANQGFTYGVAQPLNANNYSRAGYTFAGWNTQSNGNGTSYTDQQSVSNLTANHGETVNLYAQWEPISYTVHFDANYDNNGIVITGTMSDQNFIYDQTQSLAANAFEREGYIFTGWATQPDGMVDYNDGQPVSNLTYVQNGVVTLYAKWDITPWTGSGISENNPYFILYASQLMKLAHDVNSGTNEYQYKFFKLGDDIDMSGIDFEGIGYSYNHYFKGYFNGDNKTISNLTVNKPNTSYVGLFGYLTTSVSNIILSDATITGGYATGAIAGRTTANAALRNCLVINTNINSNNAYSGVFVGDHNSSATLTHNYYYNCTLNKNNTPSTINIGIGSTNGSTDVDDARSAHTLTLPEHIIATSAETVTYDQVTYYASNVNVTITLEQGCYITSDVTVNGTTVTDNGDGTWSFTMPAADATVSATVMEYKITVNDGTDVNYYVPFSSFYCDRGTHSQFIIPAADLTAIKWGAINKMTFFSNTASASWQNLEYKVYFAEVDFTTFEDCDWISGFTIISDYNGELVYNGGVSVTDNKMEITLYSPYTYCGGNLWVYFEEDHYANDPGFYEITWYGKTQTDYTAVFQNIGYGGAQFLPKVTFGYTPAPSCVHPTALTVDEVTNHTATISWTPNSNETNWHVYYSTDPTAPADDIDLSQVIDVTTNPEYTFTGLDALTKYYFWVRGNCDINDYSSWAGSDFTTEIPCAAPVSLNVSNIDHTTATLNWTSDGDNFDVKYAELPDASNEYKYDNGVYLNVMKNIYAGVLIPAGSYTESNIRKISVFDSYMNIGVACSLWICYGTTTAPDMEHPIYTGSVTYTGTNAMMDIPVGVAVENTNNLWVVMHSDEDKYSLPACSDQSGTDANANGRWHSWNGSDWSNYKYNESYRVWMIRVTLDEGNYTWIDGSSSTNSYNMSGLTDDKDYMAKVRRVCGGIDGESEWSGTSFTTRIKVFTTEGDWDDEYNWDPAGVPTINDNVVIRANATIGGGYVARAHQITFEGTPTPTLTIADGQLVSDNPAYVTMQKEIEAYSVATGLGSTDGWYFIASPVSEDYTPAGSMLANTYDLYRLNPTNNTWENFKNSAHSDFTTLANGQGYLYANSEDVTLSFTGHTKPYNNNYGVPVSAGFNLVGNPYTFAAYVNCVYYRMNSTRTGVEFVNENFPIYPSESVVIEADAAGSVVFTNVEQPWQTSTGNGNLNITLSQVGTGHEPTRQGTLLDKAMISFDEGLQLSKFYFGEQKANICIPQDGNDYAIAYSDRSGEVPVYFMTTETGSYTISFSANDMRGISLIDKIENVTIDLGEDDSYTFIGSPADRNDRFTLAFSDDDNDIFAYQDGSDIIVEGEGELQVFDALGRMALSQRVNGNERITMPQTGVYILRIVGDKIKVQKIIINK